jgi:SAM-dependent methyltransferase
MHTNSRLLFEKYALPYFGRGRRILEIGPDGFPSTYRQLVSIEELQWDTLDIGQSPHLTYSKSSLYEFPIASNSYDVILSGQVIEHVSRVWTWMRELARVIKPGGVVVTINPVSWPYHEAPIDCWRIFPDGMKALCEEAGLKVEKCFFESLESPQFANALPGRSAEWQPRRLRLLFQFLGRLGFPVEKAFDTITIARKPI